MGCKPCGGHPTVGGPYYTEVHQDVIEHHETVINNRCYAAGVRVVESWAVPVADSPITLTLLNVTDVPVGAYLYNPQYGYFHITQWNPQTGQIEVVNDDIKGTAAPGTFVSEGTLFVLAPKPCCEEEASSFFPFVAQDFVAPNVGDAVTIEVTSTFGLKPGEPVRIGSAVYLLSEIHSSKEIVITNEGGGFPGSTSVLALDDSNNHQYLLTTELPFVCNDSELVTTGRIVVCDVGTQKILTGTVDNRVPVLVDHVTGEVEYQLIDTQSIANGAINSAKIEPGEVDNINIKDGAISGNKIQFVSIDTAHLINAAVTNAKLADGSVTSTKLGDASVGEIKMTDKAISSIKMADLVDGTDFTPTLNGSTSIASSTLVGRYWIFGPWIIARYGITLNFSGAKTVQQIFLPVAGKASEGTQKWIGITTVDLTFTTPALVASHAEPTLGLAGNDVLVVQFPTATANGQTVVLQAFAIYPSR